MTDAYLIVDDREDHNWKYRLSWYFPDDADIGGSLGDSVFTEADLKTIDTSDVDSVLAYLAVSKLKDVQKDHGGFYWETQRAAQAALRTAKTAIAIGAERSMPDWAKQALAAGWKAPKGWKP
jgi:hypothetical protein